jgi:N-acetylneuraminic acid mutarotase
MKKKRTPQFGSFSLQLLLCSAAVCSMITGTLLAFFHPEAPAKASHLAAAGLTFAERVAYQRAIEEVYWHHRIWPKERHDPKPSLNAVMSQAQLESKVQDYLRNSQVLEDYWQRPITAEQLQAEMNRMAQHTKQPQVLREIFHALGDDPAVIAECLARPVLAQRLITELNNEDRGTITKAALTTTGKIVSYTLPVIAAPSGTCTDDTWTPTSLTKAPTGRDQHTAVWTGSEMIVWGGENNGVLLNTGGRYNPSTDSWTATSTTNAPAARLYDTAVWTGTEMIVWGGFGNGYLNTGGRYDPGADSWTGTSTANAPEGREYHTTVWTGSEMIVWGGRDQSIFRLDTGGRYNPGTDSWTATSTINAPSGRDDHTAVWTGSEMIVWGGFFVDGGGGHYVNTGGRYDPSADSWTATSTANAPEAREHHTAVWTESEMIVWGGDNPSLLTTGGRYDPSMDSWTATTTTNAPDPRAGHTVVWTGSEMIVWGGYVPGASGKPQAQFAEPTATGTPTPGDGGRYDVNTDSWRATSTTKAPNARWTHTAVWTGSEMIIWGGYVGGVNRFQDGGRYCAAASATPTPTATATATFSPTATATVTATPTPTPVPSVTVTPTVSPTPTATATPTATVTATPTLTPRPSPTPRVAPTPRPRFTPPPRP